MVLVNAVSLLKSCASDTHAGIIKRTESSSGKYVFIFIFEAYVVFLTLRNASVSDCARFGADFQRYNHDLLSQAAPQTS